MPDEQAAAIGRIVALWAIVESAGRSMIQCLIDLEGEPGHALTAEMSWLQQINAISALTHCIGDQDLLDHWQDICALAEAARSRRNDIVHGEWVTWETIRRTKARGRVSVTAQTVSATELEVLEAEIAELIDDMSWFTVQLARRGFKKALTHRTVPFSAPPQSRKARAQAQARETKKALRHADRDRSKQQAPKG